MIRFILNFISSIFRIKHKQFSDQIDIDFANLGTADLKRLLIAHHNFSQSVLSFIEPHMILKTHSEFRESVLHAAHQGKVDKHHFVFVDAFFERVSEASMKLMAEYGIGMSAHQRALFEEGRLDYLKKILNLYPDVSESYVRHYGRDFLQNMLARCREQ